MGRNIPGWAAARSAALERQPFCQKCHRTTELEVNHIQNVVDGGSSEPDNLSTLCKRCHQEWTSLDGHWRMSPERYEVWLELPPQRDLVAFLVIIQEQGLIEPSTSLIDILATARSSFDDRYPRPPEPEPEPEPKSYGPPAPAGVVEWGAPVPADPQDYADLLEILFGPGPQKLLREWDEIESRADAALESARETLDQLLAEQRAGELGRSTARRSRTSPSSLSS